MNVDKFLRWMFFCAGIITAIFAGYMFYSNEAAKGAACLAVCMGFLNFATRYVPDRTEEDSPRTHNNSGLHDLAVLVAELAATSLQNVGRTVPPGTKEIADIEDKLNVFLESVPLTQSEREDISAKFESLKDRARRNQGGRALIRSSRL